MKLKVVSLILSLLLLLPALFVPAAAETQAIVLETVSEAAPGDTVIVTVKTSEKYENVGGIRMALIFDTSKFSYVEGSRSIKAAGIAQGDITPDYASSDKLHFVWDTYNGVTLNGSVVTYQFKALSDVAGTADFNLAVYEMYKADKDYTAIAENLYVKATVSFGTRDSAVDNVINMISALGEVKYTDECKAAIDSALTEYGKLTVNQQNQITNYGDLVKALNTYNELKKQNAQAANNAAAKSYRDTYKRVLALNKDTVALSDKNDVNKALKAWEDIASNDVKGLLVAERNLLKLLSTRIEELEKIKEDEEYEQQLKKEAEELAKQFREAYKAMLSLTVDTVDPEHRMGVNSALSEIESMAFVNTYVTEILKPEKELLEKLLEKIKQLELEADPEASAAATEADNFSRLFGWVLNLTEEQVTAEDYADLVVAQTFYELLSSEAKALLPGVSEKLSALVLKAESLQGEADAPAADSSADDSSDKVNTDNSGTAAETVTKYIRQGLNPFVLWAVIIFAVSVTALAISAYGYFTKRKLFLITNEGRQEDI